MEAKVRQGSSRRKLSVSTPAAARPLRALFMHLNQPEASPYGRERIADYAHSSMRVIQLGLAAIGHLLAQSAVQVEERTITSDSVESLGTLMAELAELAALCHQLCADPPADGKPHQVLQEGGPS